jgi:hypothetical protein
MGSAGGLVLAVSGVQCQPNIGDGVPNDDGQATNTFIAIGGETEPMMGYVAPLGLNWWPLSDIYY